MSSYYDAFPSEWQIILEEGGDDWQGTMYVLLSDGDRYGFVDIGYGSCSYCDALQGAMDEGPAAVERLHESTRESVQWQDTLEDFWQWWQDRDWETQWFTHSREWQTFRRRAEAFIEGQHR